MIYTTTGFDEQQGAAHTLLIGVGAVTHTLIVVDGARQLSFAASYDPANTEPEVTALLDLDFAAVKLAVSDSRYSFIPAEVYDEQQHDMYLQYLPFDGVGTTDVADVDPLNIKLLHQSSRIGLEALISRFPYAEIYPQVLGLLSAVTVRGLQANEPLLVIERHAPWVTISVFDGHRFLYCHDFEVSNEDDFTYHLLAVVNRFGFGSRRPSIYLAGDIERGGPDYERAGTYGGNVALADSRAWTGIHVPDDVKPNQHRFLSLLGLYQCV